MENTQDRVAVSYFDGEPIFYLGKSLLAGLLTIVTLGIGLPWAVCMMMRWTKSHSVINGCRLKFTGTGLQLLGMWLPRFRWLRDETPGMLCIRRPAIQTPYA